MVTNMHWRIQYPNLLLLQKHKIIVSDKLKNNLPLCSGLHSALLRLLATNYPHLCLVEDWVYEEEVTGTLPLLRRMMLSSNTCRYTQSQLHQGEQDRNYNVKAEV